MHYVDRFIAILIVFGIIPEFIWDRQLPKRAKRICDLKQFLTAVVTSVHHTVQRATSHIFSFGIRVCAVLLDSDTPVLILTVIGTLDTVTIERTIS